MSNVDTTAHTRLSFETFLAQWEEEKRETELEDEQEWQELIVQWDREDDLAEQEEEERDREEAENREWRDLIAQCEMEDEAFLKEMEEDEKQLEWEKGLEVPPSL
ncbi:MAG: hypothetical protein ACR2HF_12320 [Methylococcaceae bacterium]